MRKHTERGTGGGGCPLPPVCVRGEVSADTSAHTKMHCKDDSQFVDRNALHPTNQPKTEQYIMHAVYSICEKWSRLVTRRTGRADGHPTHLMQRRDKRRGKLRHLDCVPLAGASRPNYAA